MKMKFYGSDEEMWADLDKAMKEANAKVKREGKERRKRYKPGDIVLSDSGYGFPVFHEILDIEKLVEDNLEKCGDEYENEGISTLYTRILENKKLLCKTTCRTHPVCFWYALLFLHLL